jgi:ribosomal protein L35
MKPAIVFSGYIPREKTEQKAVKYFNVTKTGIFVGVANLQHRLLCQVVMRTEELGRRPHLKMLILISRKAGSS